MISPLVAGSVHENSFSQNFSIFAREHTKMMRETKLKCAQRGRRKMSAR
jgi:hypothetical protein